jgi:hypothetical protein
MEVDADTDAIWREDQCGKVVNGESGDLDAGISEYKHLSRESVRIGVFQELIVRPPSAVSWLPHTLKSLLASQSRSSSVLIWGARLRWAAGADNEPMATEGGDPSGTYKRWFGRVSGRAGWWRGSSLVRPSYWPECYRGIRAGLLPRVRSCPTDGRFDTVAARNYLVPQVIMVEQGMAES